MQGSFHGGKKYAISIDVRTSAYRAGNSAEAVHEVGLGHADTRILDDDGLGLLVGDEANVELGLSLDLGLVLKALIADLVERVRGVGDELAEENFLVGIEGVDDKRHQLVDLGLEGAVAMGVGVVSVIAAASPSQREQQRDEDVSPPDCKRPTLSTVLYKRQENIIRLRGLSFDEHYCVVGPRLGTETKETAGAALDVLPSSSSMMTSFVELAERNGAGT